MIFNDRVKQITDTIGTIDYALGAADVGYETFASSFSDGDITSYCCANETEYEVGHCTVSSSGTVLTRDLIIRSSNNNSKVDWPFGSKYIFCSYSASFVPRYGHGAPLSTTNPPINGSQYIDLDSGSVYVCLDNAIDNNIWVTFGLSNNETIALVTPIIEEISIANIIALG